MPDSTAPTRDEALVPAAPKTRPRRRRFGVVAFGIVVALGMGLAGGANLHRLANLDQTAPWLYQIGAVLLSSFEAACTEIGRTIETFTSRPGSVAQAHPEAASATPNNADLIDRAAADLSLRLDQVRAATDGTARDLGAGIEHIRSSTEQNHRELVAKLAQLAERMEHIERQVAAAAAPAVAQPVVLPPTPSPAKPVAKPAPRPATDAKAKVVPKQTSTETKPGMDAKGILNWTVRDVFDGTAILEGPRGAIDVTVGDTIPGIGRVQAITRSGKRWVVTTTKGVITPRLPRTSAKPASGTSVSYW